MHFFSAPTHPILLRVATKGLSGKLRIALHPGMAHCNLAAGREKWWSIQKCFGISRQV
jgi:hypothetical protein